LFPVAASTIAHIYPSVLQALAGRGRAGRLKGVNSGGIGAGLCTILHVNFREYLFHAVG